MPRLGKKWDAMQVTIDDPERVSEATVDSHGRVAGLSDYAGRKIKFVVAEAEETESEESEA